jgi:hypothetical protein
VPESRTRAEESRERQRFGGEGSEKQERAGTEEKKETINK